MRVSNMFGAPCASVLRKWGLTLGGTALLMVVPAIAQDVVSSSNNALPNAPSTTQITATSITVSHSLTFGERARIYGHTVFSPGSIVGPAFGAAIGQWEDEPPEWNEGGEGYGRRFASGVGREMSQKTITFGVAAIDGEDPRYFRSTNPSVWGRTKHAIVWAFVSPTASGREIPAFSKLFGFYGGAFIANAWYPEYPANRDTAGDAAIRGTTALGASIGFHAIRAFMPFRRDDAGR